MAPEDLPDWMVVAEPEVAVRMLDEFPSLYREIFAGPVKPGTVLVIDVAEVMRLCEPKIDW